MAILYTVYDESVDDRIQDAAKAPTPSPITTTTTTSEQATSTIPTTTTTRTTTTTTTLPTEPTPFVMHVDSLGEITGYLDGEFNDVVTFRVSRALKRPSHTIFRNRIPHDFCIIRIQIDNNLSRAPE